MRKILLAEFVLVFFLLLTISANTQKDKLEKEYQNAINEVKKAIKLTNSKEQHKLLNVANSKKSQIKIIKKVNQNPKL